MDIINLVFARTSWDTTVGSAHLQCGGRGFPAGLTITLGRCARDRGLHVYLAPINRAGGLYGRILTEVVSTHDLGQRFPIQTD